MEYMSVAEAAKQWNISERSVRNYCSSGKIKDAYMSGKSWKIPKTAEKPQRVNQKSRKNILLGILRREKASKLSGGIYHKIQIELTYNSNHIEGSRLTHEQTQYIFETNTIGFESKTLNVDDIVETANHFKCVDMVIDSANMPLSERFIKQLHAVLKSGTSDSRKDWFAVGDYKKVPNEVGGQRTAKPSEVKDEMKKLLKSYNSKKQHSFDEILDFHYRFEKIHPFQDGNGRVGRLIMFKECLCNDITPFIIDESLKMYYYRGLHEWKRERGYLRDTCLTAQDRFQAYLDYFDISQEKTMQSTN